MKKLFIVGAALAVAVSAVNASEIETRSQASRAAVKMFFGSLKGELEGAMKAGGPTHAIDVCNKKAPGIAKQVSDEWYILSAEHGLISPSLTIEPYNTTLNAKTAVERRQWALQMSSRVYAAIPQGAHVTLLAGRNYRDPLLPYLERRGCTIEIPLKGLGMGSQKERLMQLIR